MDPESVRWNFPANEASLRSCVAWSPPASVLRRLAHRGDGGHLPAAAPPTAPGGRPHPGPPLVGAGQRRRAERPGRRRPPPDVAAWGSPRGREADLPRRERGRHRLAATRPGAPSSTAALARTTSPWRRPPAGTSAPSETPIRTRSIPLYLAVARLGGGLRRSGPAPTSRQEGMVGTGMHPAGEKGLALYYVETHGHPSVRIRRATLRTDRFASTSSTYVGGELLTKPLTSRAASR